MSKLLRVGGGYSNKCSNCDFSSKEIKKYREEIITLMQKNDELQEKIDMMIEEKAVEDLNVFSKLEQLTNMVEKSFTCGIRRS
jgi:uncharacterized coiled-coil DUF342 family protein